LNDFNDLILDDLDQFNALALIIHHQGKICDNGEDKAITQIGTAKGTQGGVIDEANEEAASEEVAADIKENYLPHRRRHAHHQCHHGPDSNGSHHKGHTETSTYSSDC
jgi:hypothetical protein